MARSRAGCGLRGAVLWIAILLATPGCDGPGPALPRAAPEPRPSDGLLRDAGLQEVVELQVRRDADGLIERLRSPEASLRARAALALASVQALEAVPDLLEAASDAGETGAGIGYLYGHAFAKNAKMHMEAGTGGGLVQMNFTDGNGNASAQTTSVQILLRAGPVPRLD